MAFKTIKLEAGQDPRIGEYLAAGAITPGHILSLDSNGKVVVHATAGGTCRPLMVALENSLAGKTISDAYTTGEAVQVWFPKPGDIALLRVLDGENLAVADLVESGASGLVREVDADASAGEIALNSHIGQCLTACDMSGSSGEDPTAVVQVRIS